MQKMWFSVNVFQHLLLLYYCFCPYTWRRLFYLCPSEVLVHSLRDKLSTKFLNSHQSCLTWPCGKTMCFVLWIQSIELHNSAFRESYQFCIMCTARCCNNTVWYDVIFHTTVQWLRQNITEFQFIKDITYLTFKGELCHHACTMKIWLSCRHYNK